MNKVRKMYVKLRMLAHGEGLPLPAHQTSQAAGLDLYAAISEDALIPPGEWTLIPCGFAMELHPGYEAQVRPRSGLALKHGVTVLNAPGTIDADYRGEVAVMLLNAGHSPFTVRRGDRVAQMVVARHETVCFTEAKDLTDTDRGENGYGSTGLATSP